MPIPTGPGVRGARVLAYRTSTGPPISDVAFSAAAQGAPSFAEVSFFESPSRAYPAREASGRAALFRAKPSVSAVAPLRLSPDAGCFCFRLNPRTWYWGGDREAGSRSPPTISGPPPHVPARPMKEAAGRVGHSRGRRRCVIGRGAPARWPSRAISAPKKRPEVIGTSIGRNECAW